MERDLIGGHFMRAFITVIGKDNVGIVAKVSSACAEFGVDIQEVTQSILQDMFAMIMLVDIDKSTVPFDKLQNSLSTLGKAEGLKIHIMHEDIFNSMHRI